MLRLLGVSFLFLTFAACVVTTAAYFKTGATKEDFRVDREQCTQDAYVASRHGAARADEQTRGAVVDECLRQKGWRKATPEELEQHN